MTPAQAIGPDGRLPNGLMPGGALIAGRTGRKGCAASRQRVKANRRRLRHKRGATTNLAGSEKPNPKPGVYFSAAPASGSVQAKGYRTVSNLDRKLPSFHARARLRERRGGRPLKRVGA